MVKVSLIFLRSYKSLWVQTHTCQTILRYGSYTCEYFKISQQVFENSPDATGRIALWAMELSEFNIQYRPRTAIKGQVVADFIAEFTLMDNQGAEKIPQWNIYTD